MDIISLLITLVIFGVLLYVVTLIPMDATVRKIIIVIAILAIVLWLLQGFDFYNVGSFGGRR